MENLDLDKNERLSLQRPAWTSTDLSAGNHRHIGGRVIENHFIKTCGFLTVSDLIFARGKYSGKK